jgi:hypothetical protein
MSVSRRNFLKAAGLTVGVASVGGVAMANQPGTPDEYLESKKDIFDRIYDRQPSEIINEFASNTPPHSVQEPHEYKEGDAFIPEAWAQEGLAILEESLVVGALVCRDFQDRVACVGDVVAFRRPGSFTAGRRTPDDLVHFSDDNVVPLDEHLYCHFLIRDGEYVKSFQELVELHIQPGMRAMAATLDMCLMEKLTRAKYSTTAHSPRQLMLGARQTLTEIKGFRKGRNAIIPASWEPDLLNSPGCGWDGDKAKYFGFDIWPDARVKNGIAFHSEGAVLSNRPLALPVHFDGVEAARHIYNGLSLRCVMQYDIARRGTCVAFDMLNGTSILDHDLICHMNLAQAA